MGDSRDPTARRRALTRLAARGTPRGADAVLAAAERDAAGTRAGSGSAARRGDVVPLTGDDRPPAVDLHGPEPARRPWRALVAALGSAALLGSLLAGVSVLTGGSGGADSPEEAVRDLAAAIAAEDPLAAVDVLAPDEVRTLHDSVAGASDRAQELELVDAASAPLRGVDLAVDGLVLEAAPLADGFAQVSVHAGRATAHVRPDDFTPLLRSAAPEAEEDVAELAIGTDFRPYAVEPFVVAVERDGRWYVSAAYTVLEYVRRVNDLPAAEYGAGRANAARLGADSPEQAARDLADALAAADWDRVWSLLPPDEIPLYDYRAALGELLADGDAGDFGFTVDTFDVTASVEGDTADVLVRATGTDEHRNWVLSGDCLTIRERAGESGGENLYSQTCLPDRGFPLSFWSAGTPGDEPVSVRAVRRDGRWFVSPVGTALDHLDRWVAAFDRRSLLSTLGLFDRIEPDGALVLGQRLDVVPDAPGLVYVYTFAGEAGQRVIGEIRPAGAGGGLPGGDGVLYGADGAQVDNSWGVFAGEPARLPETGTYRVAVYAYRGERLEVTLWDAADAPDRALDPYGQWEDCRVEVQDGAEVTVCEGRGWASAASDSGGGVAEPAAPVEPPPGPATTVTGAPAVTAAPAPAPAP